MRNSMMLALAVLYLAPVTAGATTVRALTTEAMTTDAEVIAVGRCVDVRTEWQGRVLVTLATIEVSETLKGSGTTRLVVTLPGGIDANRRIPVAMTYPGAPTIHRGESVFLFLDQTAGSSALTVSGFSQGKYSIATDPSGTEVVTRDLEQVTLVGGTGITRGSRNRLTLSELRRQVQAFLGR